MTIDTEITYRKQRYHIKGRLPVGNTPSDIAYAMANTVVRVMVGEREHNPVWRKLRRGPRHQRVVIAAMRARS